MTYLVIEDFKLGQDNRKPKWASPPGSLAACTNAHITSGGDVEKRKAFVSTYTLPSDETLGLAAVGGKLYAFGSVGGFASGTITMDTVGTDSDSCTITEVTVNGKSIWLSPDIGVVAWTNGSPADEGNRTTYMTTLAQRINNSATNFDPHYTAVASTNTITLTTDEVGTGPNGYVIAVSKTGSVTFSVTAFASGVATPTMPNGVNYQFLEHPDADEDLARVLDVDPFDGKLYVVAEFTDASVWHYYDGELVASLVDNRARGYFDISSGTTGSSTITSITVDSVEVMGQTVTYGATAAVTAELVVAAINSFVSVPNYTASAQDGRVFILASSDVEDGPNGFVLSVTTSGVTTANVTDLAGGAVLASGTYASGYTARTAKTKMYTTTGSLLRYSGTGDPTVHDPASTSNPGAGASNISNHAAGSEELLAVETFFAYLAIFARSAVQLWSVYADATANTQAQVIKNTGTIASKSVVSYGDSEVAYLTSGGIRGLRSRDINGLGAVIELGSPIDSAVKTQIAAQTEAVKAAALAIVEPVEKRLWVVIGDKVYVYSRYTKTGIEAWSVYEPGFSISDAAVVGDRLYVRSGDTIYLYGGSDGDTYGSDYTVTAELPFVDGKRVASFKEFTSLDVGCEGTWTLVAAFDPQQPTTYTALGIFTGPTFSNLTSGMAGTGYTHVAPKFTHLGAGYARLSNLALHYDVVDAA